MIRKIIYIAIALGLSLQFLGCAGRKVRTLEEQVADLQTQNADMQAEMESLQAGLAEARQSNQSMQTELQAKEETIAQQEDALSDLRFQNLELKANLEETQTKKSSVMKAATLSGDFGADYQRALDLFHKRWYLQAAALFKKLADSDRTHDLADNCQYWLGECYYAQKQYENAMAEFEKVFTFPNTNKADAAQLKIGLCWLELKEYPEAREQLIRLLSVYPSSEYVPRARIILDKIP